MPANINPNSFPARVYRAHWAEGGGEEQPYFIGWFEAVLRADGSVSYHREIPAPYAWRPITQNTEPSSGPKSHGNEN
jgi:hypothetical protein